MVHEKHERHEKETPMICSCVFVPFVDRFRSQ